MATVKLTIRVRDAMNRVRVQEVCEVAPSKIQATAERMAGHIQRQFQKVSARPASNGHGKDSEAI
jgi:predicted Co/Zn/Cd cation transporter (cation efflux family)